jgi:methylase of polypeptide subunit release factors
MDTPYLSMIPLFTVARYTGSPYGYDSEKAWQDALVHLAGPEGARAIRPMMLLFKDYGWTDNVFTPIYTPGKVFNMNSVRDALTLMEEQLTTLKSDNFSDNTYIQKVIPELEPYIAQIRKDYDAIVSNPNYVPDVEGYLTYQTEREAVFATHKSVLLDGNLDEWEPSTFKALYASRNDENNRVKVAFNYTGNSLYIAVDVKTNSVTSTQDTTWIGGDQLLLIFDYTPEIGDTWIQPQDLVWLIRPPDETGNLIQKKGSMVLTPFSQRGISDITMRSISSFFSHYMKPVDRSLLAVAESAVATGQQNPGGYQLELMIPVGNLDSIRLNMSLNDIHQHHGAQRTTNFIFSRRPYIGNVYTYAEIIFR